MPRFLLQFVLVMCPAATAACALSAVPSTEQLLPYFTEGQYPLPTAEPASEPPPLVCQYRLYRPPNLVPGRSYPLILWLHGYGDVEAITDNRGQLEHVGLLFDDPTQLENAEFCVLALQCPPEMTRWFHNEGPHQQPPDSIPLDEPGEIAMAIVDELIASGQVDAAALTLVGISAGGTAGWEMAMRYPHRFAAVALLAAGEGDLRRAGRLRSIPIWCFHVRGDVGTPVEGVARMADAVRQDGGIVKVTQFPGSGHASWGPAFQQKRLRDWLLAQRRESWFSPPPGKPPWLWWQLLLQIAIPLVVVIACCYERHRRTRLAASLLLICFAQQSLQSPFALGGEAGEPFVVLTFNTGTTLGLQHDTGPVDGYGGNEAKISDEWYGNGLAWPAAINAVRKLIRRVDPDIVAFQEIFDCRNCDRIPAEKHAGFVCEGWSPGNPDVPRMVLGDAYQIACHPGKRSKCLAVHRRFGTLRGCRDGDCEDALEGAPVAGCGGGARVARAIIDRPDRTSLTVISIHGTSGFSPTDQQCRVRQVERIFVDWGDGKPGIRGERNLILGDFNTDPGRAASIDASAARWNDFVGAGKPFRFLSRVGPDAPRAYRGFADIDHIVSDCYRGTCRYPGVDPGEPPVYEGVYFDHVPVVCTLSKRTP